MKQQEDFFIQPDREQTRYQTGKTTPPERKQRLLPVLLVLFLFLGSIVSTLSLLNIRLFPLAPYFQEENQPHISFFHSKETSSSPESFDQLLVQRNAPANTSLGITVENLSEIDRHYYNLPQGLLISSVDARSDAAHKGIRQGDVLISVNGSSISSQDALCQLLNSYSAGSVVRVKIYRNNVQYSLWLSLA